MDIDIIYVNDGSQDDTTQILHQLQLLDNTVSIVQLSRNFGKEIALQAGLDYASGDAVVIIDADLQDPPELIPQFIEQWQAGFDVVYAKRISRLGESWFKRTTAFLFYRLMRRMTHFKIPTDTGDFRLLSQRAVQALKQLREKHRYMKGLFAWIGYPQIAIPFTREARIEGKSKWNYWKLFNLAIEGITSFTIAPLKLASIMGFVTALGAFIYAMVIVYKTLIFGEAVQGYPSLMVVILFLGGIQLISLGILGEYLGRMFMETKQRPLYLVQEFYRPKTLDSFSSKKLTTSNIAASLPAVEAVTK